MRTYSAKPSEITAKWWFIDAEDVVLGRLSAEVAKLLRGKHKPQYTPHIDCGDHVIVINAEKIKITGRKASDRVHYWHTGYPGGIKETNATKTLSGKFPQRVVERAVKRMLPGGPLAHRQFAKLRVYAGATHPHEAQKPQTFDIASKNPKNKR